MLRDHEKTAVYSLVIRQVEAQELRAKADALMAKAKADQAAAAVTLSNVRAALAVFGFDMSQDKPWNAVRDAIGQEAYSRAIRIGEGKESERPIHSFAQTQADDQDEDQDQDDDFDDSTEQLEEPAPPKVREIVLAQLASAGTGGVKASAIKKFIATQGIETHDKTVGMTLYRLSREGVAKRDGRTWYFVPPDQRNEPSDEESGEDASEGSEHQPPAEGRKAGPGGGT